MEWLSSSFFHDRVGAYISRRAEQIDTSLSASIRGGKETTYQQMSECNPIPGDHISPLALCQSNINEQVHCDPLQPGGLCVFSCWLF
jgi:hypothetical protein